MVSSRSYYPGFLAALFLVLLRIAIGWHFLYEGLWKYQQYEKPFSAEAYFRASAGPLASYFHRQVPDFDGLKLLERDGAGLPANLKASWSADLERYAQQYKFDEAQKAKAVEALENASATADAWFRQPDHVDNLKKYADDLAKFRTLETDPNAVSYQKELVAKELRKLNQTRNELLDTIDAWTESLQASWAALATPETKRGLNADHGEFAGLRYDFRKSVADRPTEPMSRLDWLNTATIYGLMIAGACLILGLFTRLAALWSAGFLALIYLSLPPWPGLPENPLTEGHYLFVSKNLIELIACLAIAALPTHHWVGIDALLFGARRRRKLAARAAREEEESRTPNSNVPDYR